MGLSGPKGAPKVGPKRSPPKGAPRGYKSKGKGAPKANPSLFSCVNSTLLQYHRVNSPNNTDQVH